MFKKNLSLITIFTTLVVGFFTNSHAQQSGDVLIKVVSVQASSNDGNVPGNVIDNNLNTRWSANGSSQFIDLTFDNKYSVTRVEVAFYRGNLRQSTFDVSLLVNNTLTKVLAKQKSVLSSGLSSYAINSTLSASSLRITGYGNTENTWNSITEIKVYGKPIVSATELRIASVSASSNDGNLPINAIDNNLNTRWSANGSGQYIDLALDARYVVSRVDVAFFRGDVRQSTFDVSLLSSGLLTKVITSQKSISGLALQSYPVNSSLESTSLRITGYGNTENTWNSITEIKVYGRYIGALPPPVNLSCGSVPSGGTESIVRYEKDVVPAGSQCLSQTQTRTCTNGVFSAFSPNTYQFTSCSVSATPGGTSTYPFSSRDVGVTTSRCPSTLAVHPSSSLTTTTDGQIIQNLRINGIINVRHKNVIIRCVYSDAQGGYFNIDHTSTGLVVEDSELVNSYAVAIDGNSFTVRRVYSHDHAADSFKASDNTVFEESYIERLGTFESAHADGIQISGGSNIRIVNNNFEMPRVTGFKNDIPIFIGADFAPINGVHIEGNRINGGGWSINMGAKAYPVSNVQVINNFFGRGAVYGPMSLLPGTVQSGNRWEDTKQLIP